MRRLNPDKLTNIIPAGIVGLKSDEILRRHNKVINKNVGDVDEVIIHIGTNDLSTKSPKAIVHHVDYAVQSIKSKNPDVNMAASFVFLQKKNSSLNKATGNCRYRKPPTNLHKLPDSRMPTHPPTTQETVRKSKYEQICAHAYFRKPSPERTTNEPATQA